MPLIGRIASAAARGYGLFANVVQAAVDPYFNYVVALLHGDGTNGGQNNTFLDSSTNNFTITRNGNTTQGSFSPFSQTGWSNYFDGAGDWLSVANNAALNLGTGDFTIECWVYPDSSISNVDGIIGKRNQSGFSGGDWRIAYISASTAFGIACGTNTTDRLTPAIALNSWNHIAFVRSSGTLSCYANGVRGANLSWTDNLDNTETLLIGLNVAGFDFPGYISNVRIVKGTAVYSGATYTVPTTPLTAITNTSLLTCQANRFLDASSNNFTITRNGDVSVQPFSPFNPTSAYSTSAVGGSGYFDGSGDYLALPDNAAFDIGLSSQAFTIETFFYPTSTTTDFQMLLGRGGGAAAWNGTDGWQYAFFLYNNLLYLQFWSGSGLVNFNASLPISQIGNQFNHLVASYNGTNVSLFANGTRLATTTATFGKPTTSNITHVGKSVVSAETYYAIGYISNLRIVKGTAVYDPTQTTYTVPTTPLTAITNTSLLLNFTNGAIFDNAADADYETVGNAQISTSVKKYGTGSLAFDGTGDWLVSPASPNWDFGSGDFTVELWINPSATTAGEALVSKGNASSTGNEVWTLQWYGTNQLAFFSGGGLATPVVNTGSVFATGNWYHVAVCRAAGVTKIFVNGTVQGTSTTSYTITAGGALYVGAGWFAPASRDISGYIDDLRISKGVARYLYNFTPPTAEFPNIGGTVTLTADPYFDYTTLLLPGNGTNGAQNNTFLDSSTNAFSITRNGNTTQGTFSPFSQTGWGNYFDGTGDWLNAGAQTAYNFGTGDFTVETWVYCTASTWTGGDASGATVLFDTRNQSNSTEANRFTLGVLSSGSVPWFYNADANVRTDSGVPALVGTWNHIAWTRASGTVRIFVNGVQGVSFTDATSFSVARLGIAAGAAVGGGTNDRSGLIGYLSNARWVKGTAVYTSNFTPPTAPLTAITNTSLLTCQSNRFIDNSTNNFAITRNGDVSVQAFSPFNPTAAWSAATYGGSGYFDGSGDFLSVSSSNQIFPSGTQDFSVEFYTYFVSAPNQYPVFLEGKEAVNGFQIVYVNDGGANQGKLGISANGVGPIANATFSTYFNQWVHVVATRSGNNFRLFFNGTLVAYASNSQSFATVSTQTIGAQASGSYPTNAYITNIRSCLGAIPTSYQTSSTTTGTQIFTSPTAPVTTSSQGASSVAFLANFTNAGIYDATSKNDLETVGNAQISTTQSKFGGSSMYFDGTGDWLQTPVQQNFVFGTGDFTVEFWLYANALSGYQNLFDGRAVDGTLFPVLWLNNTAIEFFANGSVRASSTVATSTWYHVALSRYGSSTRLFVNGIQVGSTYSDTNNYVAGSVLYISRYAPSATNYLNGYLDDFRVTKGIARYTSNFTPPTTAFLTL